jgi:hypothetical protein
MSTLLSTLLFIGIILLAFGVSFWLFLGFMIFLGAAMIPDLHDGYPTNEDFEEYDRKKVD